LLSHLPGLHIVDVSHNIQPFNAAQAAFVLRNCYRDFPDGTVHMICVGVDQKDFSTLIIETEKQLFICANNGMAGLIFESNPENVFQLESTETKAGSFPEKDVWAPVALKLLQGHAPKTLGSISGDFKKQVKLHPTIDENVISGSVVYIDSYRNLISNISKDLFDKQCNNRKFEIYVQSNHYKITRLNAQYSETSVGELLALFNSSGLLEIAINNGHAADLLSVGSGAAIRIKFLDKR